jgi:hypothetical protein
MNARRARPSEALIAAQREGKAQWRREMAARPFKEKVQLLLEMQRRLYPVIAARRPLQFWQRPWPVDG